VDPVNSTPPTPIQRLTAAHFAIDVESLRSGGRLTSEASTARHVARYLERERGLSFQAIGKLYACDHTTVLASVNHVTERVARFDVRYVPAIQTIRKALHQEIMHAKAAQQVDTIVCPTCGAPVIQELQRQIAQLQQQVEQLKGAP
jgi:putative intracellular protease/amidase